MGDVKLYGRKTWLPDGLPESIADVVKDDEGNALIHQAKREGYIVDDSTVKHRFETVFDFELGQEITWMYTSVQVREKP
jgi:hypothetical protein